MNALEGLRVVLSLVVIFVAVFAAINSQQGMLALAKIMRERIRSRRKIQMTLIAIEALILGAQSAYVTQIPNPIEPALAVYTSNLSVITTLLLMFAGVIVHISGWWREGTIIKVPLSPDAEEKAKEAVLRAREIAHTSRTSINVVSITLEDLLDDPLITADKKTVIRDALGQMITFQNHIDDLHAEIKILQPLVVGMDDA